MVHVISRKFVKTANELRIREIPEEGIYKARKSVTAAVYRILRKVEKELGEGTGVENKIFILTSFGHRLAHTRAELELVHRRIDAGNRCGAT